MTFNGHRWAGYVTNLVCPDFQRFGDVVRDRILPVFDGINQEADEHAARRYDELMSNAPSSEDWDDASAFADDAINEGFDHYEMLVSMRFATVNMFSAALYHLTEQHVVDLAVMIADHHERTGISVQEAIAWFNDTLGLDMKALSGWTSIEELRLLANVVKHGEGRSAEELRKIRPDLFDLPQFKPHGFGAGLTRVRKPLFGQDLYVTPDDFKKFHESSVAFWREVAGALPALTP